MTKNLRQKLYGIEQEVTLKDGSAVYIREVRKTDNDDLLALYSSLSQESLTFRFFSKPSLESVKKYVERALNVDYKNSYGIVAMYGDKVVGHAEYVVTSKDTAEVAFTVLDEFQGKGVGTAMLGVLAEIAEKNGIKMFEAVVRPDNYKMISVFRDSGFPVKIKLAGGEIIVKMPTAITEDVLEVFERRDKLATVNALRRFLNPKSVAVIGASRDRNKVGGKTLYNILVYGYKGVVYPVNKVAKSTQGVKAYPSILDIPDDVDLAVISVPAEHVIEIAKECGKKGVKALLVLSAGFAEIDEEGKKRQEELVKICREFGMRIVGPNCMGLLNTDPNVRLNATFAPNPSKEGSIGFASQSGAVGLAVIDYVNAHDLGLSSFVSLGNRADISNNDLIEYWEDDERTKLIMLYLESFGNPRKFARIAKRVSRKKPILALASGITPAGAKAVSSHTGAMISSSGIVVDAFFKQTGIIRASSLDELFAIASFILNQPLPKGKNVAIITNGGGLGAITSDWCENVGLKVPDLFENTQKKLREILPTIASVRNPVDMTAGAKAEDYSKVIKYVSSDEGVDSLIVIFVQAVSREEVKKVVENVIDGSKKANNIGKPVIFIYLGTEPIENTLSGDKITIPVLVYPNIAAKVLSKTADYAEWKMKPKEPLPSFEVDKDKAAAIIAKSLGKREWMRMDEAFELLRCYGLSIADYVFAQPSEIENVADKIKNFEKVAVKLVSEKIIHKTEHGAVKLNLDWRSAIKAAKDLVDQFKDAEGVIFQRMIDGIEMFIGVAEDPSFGPLITCGAGGEFVELFKDISVRVTPITKSEAFEMVENLKSYQLLKGYRGRKGGNVDAFVDSILRINALVEDFSEIVEMDCNPVMVHESGADVVDVRIRLRK